MSDADAKDNVEKVDNEYVEDGTNKLLVKCKFCGSKILDRKAGKFVAQEVLLKISLTFQ